MIFGFKFIYYLFHYVFVIYFVRVQQKVILRKKCYSCGEIYLVQYKQWSVYLFFDILERIYFLFDFTDSNLLHYN